ncbi:MAG: CFI-box-CTERM domain-containing protein [Candidatus Nitrosotenuis sp.]
MRSFHIFSAQTSKMNYIMLLSLLLNPVVAIPIFADFQQLPTDQGTLLVNISTDPEKPSVTEQTKLKIDFINPQTNVIQEHIDYKVTVTNDGMPIFGPIPSTHTSLGSVTIPIEFKGGENKISIHVEGILFQPIPLETVYFNVIAQEATPPPPDVPESGCLIATAAHGTELAPQVQMLREIRDNILFGTGSGKTFMSGFNEFYYSFSPNIADLERQSPVFREMVKATMTPMLVTLSILSYSDIDSESEMLGYGIGVILLNAGIYFVIPAIAIIKTRKFIKKFTK